MYLYKVELSNDESFGFMCYLSAEIFTDLWNMAGMETQAELIKDGYSYWMAI